MVIVSGSKGRTLKVLYSNSWFIDNNRERNRNSNSSSNSNSNDNSNSNSNGNSNSNSSSRTNSKSNSSRNSNGSSDSNNSNSNSGTNDIRIRLWLVRISPAVQLMESNHGGSRLRSVALLLKVIATLSISHTQPYWLKPDLI